MYSKKIIFLKFKRLHLRSVFLKRYVFLILFLSSCNEQVPDVNAQNGIEEKKGEEHLNMPERFNFGKPASPEKIAAWDIDVRPDGAGLPDGKGTVAEGAILYAQKCAACHGATGTEGPEDRLVGRTADDSFPFGEDLETWENKTIGSYWPYASTIYDYIYRSMPQFAPGSLTPDEVYALTAFLLYQNKIIPENAEMNAQTLPKVNMPAHDRFVTDDRLKYAEVR